MTLSPLHTESDIDRLVLALRAVWDRLGLQPAA
jgi:hypothetical protein